MLSLIDEQPELVARALSARLASDPSRGTPQDRERVLRTRGAARFVTLVQYEKAARSGVVPPVLRGVPEAACAWAHDDPEAALRSRAAALCTASPEVSESTLLSLARDPEWIVRARLAVALAAHPTLPGATAVIQLLAEDPHPSVRRAAQSLGPAHS